MESQHQAGLPRVTSREARRTGREDTILPPDVREARDGGGTPL
jgi:hypothetical protein